MSELVDFSGTDTISIFSLQIIEPAIIFRDKSYGFSVAFFSETEDRATFSRQLVDLLNAKMGEDSPIMDLSRFLTSGKVAEKGREDALQRLVEVAAQYIDDNTKAQSSTKGIIAPPIGCVQALTNSHRQACGVRGCGLGTYRTTHAPPREWGHCFGVSPLTICRKLLYFTGD